MISSIKTVLGVLLLVLMQSAAAQNLPMPAFPDRPQSVAECSAVSQQYSSIVSQVTQRHEECLKSSACKQSTSNHQGVCTCAACESLHRVKDRYSNGDIAQYRRQAEDRCRTVVRLNQEEQRRQQQAQEEQQRRFQLQQKQREQASRQQQEQQERERGERERLAQERHAQEMQALSQQSREMQAREMQARQLRAQQRDQLELQQRQQDTIRQQELARAWQQLRQQQQLRDEAERQSLVAKSVEPANRDTTRQDRPPLISANSTASQLVPLQPAPSAAAAPGPQQAKTAFEQAAKSYEDAMKRNIPVNGTLVNVGAVKDTVAGLVVKFLGDLQPTTLFRAMGRGTVQVTSNPVLEVAGPFLDPDNAKNIFDAVEAARREAREGTRNETAAAHLRELIEDMDRRDRGR